MILQRFGDLRALSKNMDKRTMNPKFLESYFTLLQRAEGDSYKVCCICFDSMEKLSFIW